MIDFQKVTRVLVYRLGSLGDTVVALPALHQIARTFPNAKRLMLTNLPAHEKAAAMSEVLDNSGLVDGYITYPAGTRGLGRLIGLWWKIRRFHPQVLIYLAKPRGESSVRRDIRFFRTCGISTIIGIPMGDLSQPLYLPESGIWERESARLLRTIRDLGECSIDDKRNWDLLLTETEIQTADAALTLSAGRPLIVCGPGTKMQAKDWGEENWKQLLAKLSEALPDYALVLVGAKEERQMCEYAAGGWEGLRMNLCGQLTPRQTAAVLRHAVLFLGPDSGPMHLAAAVGVPSAIVFAARTMPGIWYPAGAGHRVVYHQVDCMGCNIETCIEQGKKCLTSITVEEMLTAALEALRYGKGQEEAQLA